MLDRITHFASDLESAKVKAKSLFDTLNMPSESRWPANFGPVWARSFLLGAEDGQFLKNRMVRTSYLDFESPSHTTDLVPHTHCVQGLFSVRLVHRRTVVSYGVVGTA
jgi:hypothetical protein